MTPQATLASESGPTDTTVEITVRFFAAAKAEAGRAEHHWSILAGCTIDDAVHRAGFGDSAVFRRSSFLLNSRSVTRADIVREGDVLDVLPPFAGG